MNLRITDPNSIDAANRSAKRNQGRFQMKVNEMTPEELWKELQELPDLIKAKLESASKENPERHRRELRQIRSKLLFWYNLEEVEDIGCWQRLLDIREELKWYIDETERLYKLFPNNRSEPESNLTRSTIEDYLQPFQSNMSETDYNNLVSALMQYFNNGTFPTWNKIIQIRGKINKKKFGFAFNELFKAENKGLPIELLVFAHTSVSIFNNVSFDRENYKKSNLYKYFTTRIK